MLSSATTVEEALWLEANGADAIIAQGLEAGGHRGIFLSEDLNTQVGTLALLPQVVAAVHDGVKWLHEVALHDVAWTDGGDKAAGRRLIASPGAPDLWARYYVAATGKPIFGDRDKTLHDDVNEISVERRNGYAWFNTAPLKVFKAYAKWSRTHPQAAQ